MTKSQVRNTIPPITANKEAGRPASLLGKRPVQNFFLAVPLCLLAASCGFPLLAPDSLLTEKKFTDSMRMEREISFDGPLAALETWKAGVEPGLFPFVVPLPSELRGEALLIVPRADETANPLVPLDNPAYTRDETGAQARGRGLYVLKLPAADSLARNTLSVKDHLGQGSSTSPDFAFVPLPFLASSRPWYQIFPVGGSNGSGGFDIKIGVSARDPDDNSRYRFYLLDGLAPVTSGSSRDRARVIPGFDLNSVLNGSGAAYGAESLNFAGPSGPVLSAFGTNYRGLNAVAYDYGPDFLADTADDAAYLARISFSFAENQSPSLAGWPFDDLTVAPALPTRIFEASAGFLGSDFSGFMAWNPQATLADRVFVSRAPQGAATTFDLNVFNPLASTLSSTHPIIRVFGDGSVFAYGNKRWIPVGLDGAGNPLPENQWGQAIESGGLTFLYEYHESNEWRLLFSQALYLGPNSGNSIVFRLWSIKRQDFPAN